MASKIRMIMVQKLLQMVIKIEFYLNQISMYNKHPSKCSSTSAHLLQFKFEDNALKINPNFDQWMNTQSVINFDEDSLSLVQSQNKRGILTRQGKICQALVQIIRKLDDKGIVRVVIEQPGTNDKNKKVTFKSIIRALFFYSNKYQVNFLSQVYIKWSLSITEMLKISQEVFSPSFFLIQ